MAQSQRRGQGGDAPPRPIQRASESHARGVQQRQPRHVGHEERDRQTLAAQPHEEREPVVEREQPVLDRKQWRIVREQARLESLPDDGNVEGLVGNAIAVAAHIEQRQQAEGQSAKGERDVADSRLHGSMVRDGT